MKRKIWKRLIVVGCAASLFMTAPGMTVLANEIGEDISVTEEIEFENENAGITDLIPEDDSEADSIDDSEEEIKQQDVESVSSEEIVFEEADSSDDAIFLEDETINEDEELVGAYVTPDFSSCVSSYSELESRLETLKSWYVGSYWTTDGQPANSSGSTSLSYYGIQCNGFAKLIFTDLFNTGSIGSYDSNKYYFPNANGAYLIDKNASIGSGDSNAVKAILQYGEIGDFIQVHRRGKDYGHSMILTGKDDGGIWIFDCNSDGHCKVQHYYQSYSTFASKNDKMSLYRSVNYPPRKLYTILKDYGDDFYAHIVAYDSSIARHLGNINWNVQLTDYNDVYDPRQIWHFINQGDYSYKIINEYDGSSVMDADGSTSPNGANVSIWGDNGGDNQRWYIAKTDDVGVTLINKATEMSLDCNGGVLNPGTNVQTWEINTSSAQDFSIYKPSTDNRYYAKPGRPDKVTPYQPKGFITGMPITLSWSESGVKNDYDERVYDVRIYKGNDLVKTLQGIKGTSKDITLDQSGQYSYTVTAVNTRYNEWYTTSDQKSFNVYDLYDKYPDNFYAYIIADGLNSRKNIASIDYDVKIPEKNDSYDPKQVWHFIKQSDKTYKIQNEYDSGVLEADGQSAGNGANVWMWSDNGGENQKWYIVTADNKLILLNQATQMALDCNGAVFTPGTNVQTWEVNGSSAQVFDIYDLKNDNTNYSKPGKPSKATLSVTGEKENGKTVTIQWTESSLVGRFDKRTYNIEVYKDGKLLSDKSKYGLTSRELKLQVETGKYSIKVRSVNTMYRDWYTDSDALEFTVGKASVSNVTVTGIVNKTYTGSAQTQNPTVKLGDKTLTKDTDYTLSYTNNTNVGTATVTITGKGSYTGSISKTFTINALSIANATVTGISNKTYSGSAQTQNPTVKVGEKTLTSGTDYTVGYSNNVNAGTATVMITGKGNYTGSISKTFTISALSGSGATVTGISNKTYTGSVHTQNPTVKVNDKTLVPGTDYTISYSNNTNAGTATVKITFKGNYTGSVSKTFTINQASPTLTFASASVTKTTLDAAYTNALTKTTDGTVTFKSSNTNVATVDSDGKVTIKGEGTATITASAAAGTNYKAGSASYDLTVVDGRQNISGYTVTLSPTSYTYNGSACKPTITVKNGSFTLTSGADYTVSYSNNTNVGIGKVTITGKGNYTGTINKTFTINQATPTLTFASASVTKTTLDEAFTNALTKKTDGTVTFKSGDTGVATVDSATGLVTIKGEGMTTITATATAGTNYKAGSASYTLTVVDGRIDISTCTVTLSSTSYTYNGSAKKPTVTVKNSSTTLTSGTDYTVAYKNNTNAGTATVTITGKGNYKGIASKTFTINKAAASLKFASASIEKTTLDAAFTNELTKTTDGTVTFKSSDTGVATVDSASGLVTIKGEGTTTITATATAGTNYKAGSASYTLTVVDGRIDISTCTVTLSATSYTYNGSAKKPTVTVKNGSTTLTSGTDYTVAYKNNTNAGTATVTITGKGNYKGTVSKTFTINKATASLKFASTSVEKTTLDAAFTNELTKTADGTVTFKSGDTGVAAVDSTSGLVTIKGEGTTTITATATAGTNYKAGSASYTLTVVDGRIDISTFTVTLSTTTYTYNGSAKKPTVTVKNGSTTLKSGTDYTVAYKNNTNAGTATVTVTGKGNYKGTASKTFTINKAAASLKFASATVEKTTLDAAFTNELTKTTDGTVTFKSSDTGVATVDSTSGLVIIKGAGTTTITASATTGTNYKAGSASYTLTVVDGRIDISTCTVTLSTTSYTYNGSAKKPTVTVKNGSTTLTSGTDYTVAYKNNTNAGTATVTITGKGNYTGTVNKTFTIKKAASSLKFAENAVSKSTLDEAFTNELTKTTDGTVTFTSNDTGIASVDSESGLVTIKGAGTAVITATAAAGKNYNAGNASYALTVTPVSIEKASVAGVSLSYGYSGKAYTPKMTVKVNGVILAEGTDYTVKIENNKNPGTATITLTGIGNYTGTRIKTFEIVDCVSSLVSGKTYQMIPKNNSSTAVCAYSGRMLKNTKVYITDRSASEAMRFKAIQNSDGTWKFINAKCEMALAVQSNSSTLGAGIVLYDQTTKTAQNWKLSKKSDNSWAIMNAVTGYSVAMSDESAVKGTTLSMAETQSNGLQRFYIAETDPVDASFDGTYFIKAAKDKNYVVNISGASKDDGANVNLNGYSNTNSKKFKAIYSGAGYYRLVNVNSGLVLSVEGNTKKDGTNVIQSEWAAQSGQRWKITKNSDGTVTLTNALGTILHLSGNKTSSGTNIVAKNASTSTAQKWYLQ